MSTNPYHVSSPRTRPQGPPVPALLVVFLVIAGLVAGGFYLYRLRVGPNNIAGSVEPRPVEVRGDLMEVEKSRIQVYKQTTPSVVHITVMTQRVGPYNLNTQQVPEGTGSGFIWDKQGHVVTNFHVVKGASSAKVTLSDGTAYDAEAVAGAPDKDLAVLRIKAPQSKLVPILIGKSENLQVGQSVYAIGNPFGLDLTMTQGIVSALGREIESISKGHPIKDAIQTDAAINPGNSGGPLLDSAGLLIGVNTAIVSRSGSSAGIGFAIPVDEVNRIVPQLIAYKKVVRPVLGVQVAADDLARQLGQNSGALVVNVVPDSPAAKAGLRPTRRDQEGQVRLGDVILSVDGQEVKKASDLAKLLEKHKVGDKVKLEILRDGQKETVEVELEEASGFSGPG